MPRKFKQITAIIFMVLILANCREEMIIFPDDPDNASIHISTTPEGASIFLNGTYTTKITPDWLTGLVKGDHYITLKLFGYADTTLKINIDPATKRFLTVRLTQLD